jgi:hypothetical protein
MRLKRAEQDRPGREQEGEHGKIAAGRLEIRQGPQRR